MGLKLEKTLNTGHKVEYWRVKEAKFNYEESFIDILLDGYKNKKSRDDGNESSMRFVSRINFADITIASSDIRDDLYPKLKTKDEWTGAEDQQ